MKNKIIPFVALAMGFGLLSFGGSTTTDSNYQQIVEAYKQPLKYWPAPTIDPGVEYKEFESIQNDTQYFATQDKPEVILGKMLFFDPRLSGSSQISCSTCHDPAIGWSDRRRVALGSDHLEGKRNTPTLFNVADRELLFWDARATTLEEQALAPIQAHNEMALNLPELPQRIAKSPTYQELFKNAYGDSEITQERIVGALAVFQRTIKHQPSAVDAFIDGNYKALNDQQIYGMHLFRTKARCMNCHFGKNLTDERMHNIGLTYYKRPYEDLGWYETTQDLQDVGKFKTPTLRDLLLTRPWMHNGLFDDLTGIVNLYNSGMHMIDPTTEQKLEDPLYPVTDELLQPLQLDKQEIQAIVAFLEAYSNTRFKMRRPDYPRD